MLSKKLKSKPSECSFFCIGGYEYGKRNNPHYDKGVAYSIIVHNCQFDPNGKYLFMNDISVPLEPFEDDAIPENSIEFAQKKKIGVYNSCLSGICMIDTRAHISNVSSLCNVVVEGNSSIIDCNFVCSPRVTGLRGFSEGQVLSVGPEANGRKIVVTSGLTYTEACRRVIKYEQYSVDENEDSKKDENEDSKKDVNESRGVDKRLSIIGKDCSLVGCSAIVDVFMGDGCTCRNASIQNCTIESNVKIIDSAVQNSLLHHHASIHRAVEVDSVLMYDHSSIGHGARVVSTILAPDASVTGGECHHSLLGPMIGFHHTSLLIATIWPYGRGNIAYGAKVGANHTGRSNDQECFVGEGIFFGLGSTVKFPQNLIASPYSIIAPGTQLPPQRVSFPFSLISTGEDGSKFPSIAPGWLIWANPYMIERAEMKFSSRRKSTDYSTDHLMTRRSILEMMIIARNRLKACSTDSTVDPSYMWTDKEISGLGKCYVTEKNRKKAVDSYDLQIKQFLFRGLVTHYKELILLINRRRTEPGPDIAIPAEYDKFYDPLVDDLDLFLNKDDSDSLNIKITSKYVTKELLYILSLMKSEFEIEEEKLITLQYVQRCLCSMLLLERNYLDKVIACRKRDEVYMSDRLIDGSLFFFSQFLLFFLSCNFYCNFCCIRLKAVKCLVQTFTMRYMDLI